MILNNDDMIMIWIDEWINDDIMMDVEWIDKWMMMIECEWMNELMNEWWWWMNMMMIK